MKEEKKEITEINPRTAEKIVGTNMEQNSYNVSIQKAAKILVDAGYGKHIYQTQYASGNSVWRNGNKPLSVDVKTKEIS